MKHLSKKILDQFKQGGRLAFSVVVDEFYPNQAIKLLREKVIASPVLLAGLLFFYWRPVAL